MNHRLGQNITKRAHKGIVAEILGDLLNETGMQSSSCFVPQQVRKRSDVCVY